MQSHSTSRDHPSLVKCWRKRKAVTPLLRLKYNNAIADAVADLGKPEEIGKVFTGFQKYLYNQAA
jgi:hypothetical protein